MQAGPSRRKYTPEEKAQLLANLDLEVSHRARQFEAWLADALENFRMHQEGLISRVPRLVRDVTMREFAKYNGDLQECLKGIQRERLGGEAEGIDRTTRKRKWVEAQEQEAKMAEVEGGGMKAAKSARMTVATPKRKMGPSTGTGALQRTRLPTTKTPATNRAMQRIPLRQPSPSPQKLGASQLPILRGTPTRPASPTKPGSPSKPSTLQSRPTQRVPSSSTFNPSITSTNHPRWPKKGESMLSVNGSPLANPLGLGLDLNSWLSRVAEAEKDEDGDRSMRGAEGGEKGQGHKRTNSIIVRSTSAMSNYTTATSTSNTTTSNGRTPHSRSNSQTSMATSTHTQPSAHARTNSRTNGFVPNRSGTTNTSFQSSSSHPNLSQQAPKTPPVSSQSLPVFSLAALVSVPTKDGHLLEFDPFQTSPGEIDALEGITDSAKKQAKADMARLVMQAMERWKIS